MEILPGVWNLTPYGALVGMVVLVYVAMVRGWVVPRHTHERELAAQAAAHAVNLAQANLRGDEWKETADLRGKLISEQSAQITTLVEATKTPAEFFGTVMRDGGGKRVAETNTPGP